MSFVVVVIVCCHFEIFCLFGFRWGSGRAHFFPLSLPPFLVYVNTLPHALQVAYGLASISNTSIMDQEPESASDYHRQIKPPEGAERKRYRILKGLGTETDFWVLPGGSTRAPGAAITH